MLYLVAYYRNGKEHYDLSHSRDAVRHCEKRKAKQVRIFDRHGWIKSIAERNEAGKVYRPQMFVDGEPKQFYADKFKEMLRIIPPYQRL